ncbi:unnamed protein product [Clonostachys solani]|uniref:Uncharacterized protein n=1 Tax=Clonostachys solani TaxID=160281 RepID=A0A9P0ESB6_9HYPO|nr:unnamed protein product [Clonostachys solani]
MAPDIKFNCALVTGGAGGIGKAIAEYLISKGTRVLLAGRTESNLKETAQLIGAAGYYVVDTGKINALSPFMAKITTEHPDLDCLVNNAAVQRVLDISNDAEYLEKADEEIDINIRGPMHLSIGLLPHFRTKPSAMIINVSSVLGFIPFSVVNPVYNATKAFVHFWTMNLRTQIAREGSNIRVVEIVPPMVATDLHRDRENPDDNKKEFSPHTLTVEEFMATIVPKLEAGETLITAGIGEQVVGGWNDAFGQRYLQMTGGK